MFKRVFPGGTYDGIVNTICSEVKRVGVGIVGGLPQIGLPPLVDGQVRSIAGAQSGPVQQPGKGLPKLG
jgi:hypothetical protein